MSQPDKIVDAAYIDFLQNQGIKEEKIPGMLQRSPTTETRTKVLLLQKQSSNQKSEQKEPQYFIYVLTQARQ